jgi:HAE1 family hydrophobic/amphiphilic exporter-1
LNTITLAGLAIGVGNLVDGAIVVQENISRHRAMGKPPEEAAIVGAQEVFGAVTSSNLTTIAVFFPLIFVTGLVGQIFGGLSWAVIFSLLSSQVAAFTVIPMLAAARQGEGKIPDFVKRLRARVEPWA